MVEETFHARLIGMLPQLRVMARAMTHDRVAAEDLVQDTLVNALSGQAGFVPGTNLRAWLYRILRNRFLNGVLRRRETAKLDEVGEPWLAVPAPHEDRLALRELARAMDRLPADQRAALVMVVLQDMSYGEAADAMGCQLGTAKTRVHRARRQLKAWLIGSPGPAHAMSAATSTFREARPRDARLSG